MQKQVFECIHQSFSKKISKISKYIKCNSLCREDSSILAHRGPSRNTHVMARKKTSCCMSQRQSTNNAVYNFMGLKKFIQLCMRRIVIYITKFELVLCETFYNPCYFRTLCIQCYQVLYYQEDEQLCADLQKQTFRCDSSLCSLKKAKIVQQFYYLTKSRKTNHH